MATAKRGSKRVYELASELGMKSRDLYPVLGELDGSGRWNHHALGVPPELERRVRSFLQGSGQGEPGPSAPPVREDPPVQVRRPAAPIKVDARGGGSETDARTALRLVSRPWPLPRRFRPGQTGQLLLQWFSVSMGALAASWWLLARGERAEWLVTEGIHGHPLLMLLAVALAALCPVKATMAGSWVQVSVAYLGLLLRGAATAAICLLVLPGQGDLWNRAHELALGLGGILAISWLQFWNVLARPTAWSLALAVRWGPHGMAAAVVRRVSGVDAGELLRERHREFAGPLSPVPDWLLAAVEARATRSARRALGSPGARSRAAQAADAELELAAVLAAHDGDLRSIARRALIRVATSLAVTVETGERSEGERQPEWPRSEHRLRLIVAVLRRLAAERDEEASAPSGPLRFLADAAWASDLCAETSLLARALSSPADPPPTGLAGEIEEMARLTVALRLRDERVLGWAEAVVDGVLSRRVEGQRGDPIWLLGSVVQVLVRRETLGALRAAGLEVEARRVETETRLLAEGLGLLEFGRSSGRGRGGRELFRLASIPMAIRARALGIRRERRSMHLFGARGFRPVTLVLVGTLAGVGVWGSRTLVLGSGPVVGIHDPYRAEGLGFRGQPVVASALDVGSQEIVLATSENVHSFDPEIFRHGTEPVGGSGPSAPVQEFVPLVEGGLLARTGREGAGLESRGADGSWNTWIAPPDGSIGSPEILDLAVNDAGETLLLTSDGLLLHDASIRRLERVSLEPLAPEEPVALAQVSGEFLLIERSRILALERAGDGFRSELVGMPTGLGLATSAAVDGDQVLVRTDRDALISLRTEEREGPARRQWRVIAGGDQFRDASGSTVSQVAVAPESGSLAILLSGGEEDEVWIRKGSERFWSRAVLAGEERVAEGRAPVLAPDGEALAFLARDGRLRLVRRTSSDPLACEVVPLLPDRPATFLGGSEQGIVALLKFQGGLELRSVAWSEMPTGGTRVRTIRPMRFEGSVVGAFVRPSSPQLLVVTTSRGEVLEYDTRSRSMVGDVRELERAAEVEVDWVRTCCWSPEGLVVTDTGGACGLYWDPANLKPDEGGLALERIRSILEPSVARPAGQIATIFDTAGGFEAITESGDAWEYRLKGGWQNVAGGLAPIAADSLKRLSSGELLGLTMSGEVIWRAAAGWESLDAKLVELISSTESLTGLDAEGDLVQVTSAAGSPPSVRVLARAPRPAGLTRPIRDIHADGEAQVLWVAHEGGLSQYDIVTGEWTVPVDGVAAARRLEVADEGLFVEQTDRQLLFVRLADLSTVRLIADLRSWAVDGSGVAFAIAANHTMVRCVGGEVSSLIEANAGLVQGAPLSVTSTESALLVLEEGRILMGAAGESFTEAPIPCDDPRALARAGRDLLLLDGTGQVFRIAIDALGRGGPSWESTGISGARDLLQLDGAVLAIGVDASAWRYDERRALFRSILNGPEKDRVGPLASGGEAVELDGGLWLQSEAGVTRWEPDGGGGSVTIGSGSLRVIDGRAHHWGPAGVRRLSTTMGVRSKVVHAGEATHLFDSQRGLGVVSGGSVLFPDRGGVKIMGQSPGRGGRAVDLCGMAGGRFAVLTERGDVQVYDPSRRRFELELEAADPVGDARVYADGDGLLLVQAQSGDVLGKLEKGGADAVRRAKGVAVSEATPIALSDSGRFMAFDPASGWDPRGPVRAGGAERRIRDRVGVQGSIWMLAEDGDLLSYAGRGSPATKQPVAAVPAPRDLVALSGDRLLLLGEESTDGARAMAVRSCEGEWTPLRGVPVATGGEPLLVGPDNEWVMNLAGEELWEDGAAVEPHDPIDLVPEASGSALVLGADGRVRRYRVDRVGVEEVSAGVVSGASRLLLDSKRMPVVLAGEGVLRFQARSSKVAPGTDVLQGRDGVWSIDPGGSLNRDGEPVDLTNFPGWQRFGRFPLNVEKIEVVEAGGRVWARGVGRDLELLPGEAWRDAELDDVDLQGDLMRDGDGCLVASARTGGFVRIAADGSSRRLADELTRARLVPGASSPLVLAGDGGLLLALPVVGDEVRPLVLNEQLARFGNLVTLGPDGRFGAVDREGRVWWKERGGRWAAISEAGVAGASWAMLPIGQEESGPGSADTRVLLITTGGSGRPTVRQIGAEGAGVDLIRPLRVLPGGLGILTEEAARRAVAGFKGRRVVGPCGLVPGVDRLELSEDEQSLTYSGPFPEVQEALDGLLSNSASAWTKDDWESGEVIESSRSGLVRFGSWGGRVRKKDGLLSSRTPIRLRSTDGGRMECQLVGGAVLQVGATARPLDCNFRLTRRKGLLGPLIGSSSRVEVRHGDRWVPFYRKGEGRIAYQQAARGAGRLVFSEGLGAVLVNESGCVLRLEGPRGGFKCTPLLLGSKGVARRLELHAPVSGRAGVLVRTSNGASWVDRAGARSEPSPPPPPRLEPGVLDIEACGLAWARGERWPRVDGSAVRLLGQCFEHDLPVRCGDRGGSAAVEVVVGEERFTRRLGLDGSISGALWPGTLDAWSRTESVHHPAGRVSLDRSRGSLCLAWRSGEEEVWDSEQGSFPSERVVRAERTGDGWIHAPEPSGLIWSSLDLRNSVRIAGADGSGIANLRRGPTGQVHALTGSGVVLSVDAARRTAATIEPGEPLFGRLGPSVGYPLEGGEVGVAAARLASSGGRVVSFSGEWIPESGCFAFELVDPEALDDLGSRPSEGAIRVPSLAGLVLDGGPDVATAVPSGDWRPMSTESSGGGLRVLHSAFARGAPAPVVHWRPEKGADEVTVPWQLVDGLLAFDAIEGVSPDRAGEISAWSRMGPRRLGRRALAGCASLLPAPAALNRLLPVGGSDSWFGDYGQTGVLQDEVGFTVRTTSGLGPSLGWATREEAIELKGRESRLAVARSRTPWGRSVAIKVSSRGTTRTPELSADGFACDLRPVPVVDGSDVLAVQGGVLVRYPVGRGSLLGKSLMVESAGMEVVLGRDDSGREALEIRRPGRPPLRVDGTALGEATPLEVARDLQPRAVDGSPGTARFELVASDNDRSRIRWRRAPGATTRTLIERQGRFDHDRVMGTAVLEGADSIALVQVSEQGQLALRSDDGVLVDVGDADGAASQVRSGVDGGVWSLADGAWRQVILDGAGLAGLGPSAELTLPTGASTLDWSLEWGASLRVLSGESEAPFGSGWLPGDRPLAFAGAEAAELLVSELGLRFRSEDGEVLLAVPSGEGEVGVATNVRGPVFLSGDGDVSHGVRSGKVAELPAAELEWSKAASGVRVVGAATGRPLVLPRRSGEVAAGGSSSPFLLGYSLPCDRVVAFGASPEGMLLVTPTGLGLLGPGSKGPLVEAGPVGLSAGTRLQGPGIFSSAEVGDPGIWLGADGGEVQLHWTGSVYEARDEPAAAAVLRQTVRQEGRWSLFRDPTGALLLADTRGGIVAGCDRAIVDGALLQDRLLEVGMGTSETWIRTAATLERGVNGRRADWTVDPAEADNAGEKKRRAPAWAGRFESGTERSWGAEDPTLRRSDGQIFAGENRLLTVEVGDRLYRLESGLWMVRAAGELRWIKPGRKWH